ncbi:MAG: GNAT family N-acetyltransferase [Gammaproteobacteria bacterium]
MSVAHETSQAQSVGDIQTASQEPQEQDRSHWLLELRLAAGAWIPSASESEIRQFLTLAQVYDDWPMVEFWAGRLRETGHSLLADELLLMQSLWHQGFVAEAFDLSRRLLLSHPHSTAVEQHHAALLEWIRLPQAFPDWDRALADNGQLYLEPLGHHHVRDFLWVYDNDIAQRCCLPQFQSEDQWHEWHEEGRALGDQMSFGIWHRDWGFIGCIDLVMHDHCGFLFYWLGSPYQGQGLGPEAAVLMLDIARHCWGLQSCYAKVFHWNLASIKTLARLGFTALSSQQGAPTGEEAFYRLGEAASPTTIHQELHGLFEAMDGELRIPAPVMAHSLASARHQVLRRIAIGSEA